MSSKQLASRDTGLRVTESGTDFAVTIELRREQPGTRRPYWTVTTVLNGVATDVHVFRTLREAREYFGG